MLRPAVESILSMVGIFVILCLPVRGAETAAARGHFAQRSAPGDLADGAPRGPDSEARFAGSQSPIGIDYSPQARCSDNNPDWLPGRRVKACNPPLSQDERTCGNSLSNCPDLCEKCYSDDLDLIKHKLKVNTITVYYPNYYVLKAANRLGMKVIVGLFNDTVLGLATPANYTNCSYGAAELHLCGSRYADALIDGGCIDTIGGDPFKRCASRCALRSDPIHDCVNGDCSCRRDADCRGSGNRCLTGAYVTALNNPVTGDFLRNGTVIGIQLGNEYFGACDLPAVPGQNQPCCAHDRKTGRCSAWTITRQLITTAARTLRAALNRHGLSKVKISVALVEKQGPKFCENGKPPPGVDYISDHPYCDFVAEMPPRWTTLSGTECWKQARYREFPIDQKACGVDRTYIGETGYNTGCPGLKNHAALLKAEADFVKAMVGDEPLCKGQPNPSAPFPDFLFEFSDVGPPGHSLGGCGDPQQCSYNCCCEHVCSATARCGANCPACLGNGYFGLFHSPGHGTRGFPPVPKFNPTPSLLCPEASR